MWRMLPFRRSFLVGTAAFVLSCVILATGASAKSQTSFQYCQPWMNYCYQYHQCYINYCAGYQVDCRGDASRCGSCYNVVYPYLARQYGAVPRICRGRRLY
jgi:hypothetical protein